MDLQSLIFYAAVPLTSASLPVLVAWKKYKCDQRRLSIDRIERRQVQSETAQAEFEQRLMVRLDHVEVLLRDCEERDRKKAVEIDRILVDNCDLRRQISKVQREYDEIESELKKIQPNPI